MPGCSMHTLPFSTPRDVMLTMLVCATHWLSMHLYTLAYMFMHDSCLLVCHPSTQWSYGHPIQIYICPLIDTIFCLPYLLFACLLTSLFVCLLVRLLFLLLVMSPTTCYACFACMLVCFILIAHYLRISFFPLLACWFLVFVFACTHMERGRRELRHGLTGIRKKGMDASM